MTRAPNLISLIRPSIGKEDWLLTGSVSATGQSPDGMLFLIRVLAKAFG